METEKCEHSLTLCDRKRLSLSCVKDVTDLSPEKICVTLFSGKRMIIGGENLKISSFSRQNGQLTAEGLVSNVKYVGEKISILKKLIK